VICVKVAYLKVACVRIEGGRLAEGIRYKKEVESVGGVGAMIEKYRAIVDG